MRKACWWEQEVAGHIASAVRKQRDEYWGLAGFLLSIQSRLQSYFPQLNLSGNPLIDSPKVCFRGDSKPNRVDSEDSV